ncbi:mechanosensitive ion channel protein [Kitasatospora sp. MMS16-BH015]|uniref:mechanosensitive ion channel family protein n=1 Tax=Kitasatospora sp. MMS16-BH015 TaxID=2018025 RepID=UPI000CA20DC5|nr:mechanosensitive ion channel domain-containing protein [Kitasatospora sp. MMS16-BH015]AUG81676.1 mechanosensitive ion channel protein [Kitasatospora sp. MMS16-BH015]
MDRWAWLRLAVVVLLVVGAGWGVDRLVKLAIGRLPAAAEGVPLSLLRRCRVPVFAACASALALAVEPSFPLSPGTRGGVRHLLLLLTIGNCGWLAGRVVALVAEAGVRVTVRRRDATRARRARTQADLLRRLSQAAIALVALAAMLMTYPQVRTLGTSLLASAGLAGVVAGVGAQSTLANLFAGLQLTYGDMAQIGDVVVVNGEWGTVEEITLTYVVIATWDQRRIVMPVSYFTSRPFENWSRRDPGITGTALLHLDHSAPVAELRKEFEEFLDGHELWDGRGRAFQVVDTTPTTVVVRALMTARDGGDAFELRCQVRERLIAHLRDHHPRALPRLTIAGPLGRPGGPADGTAGFAHGTGGTGQPSGDAPRRSGAATRGGT